MAARLQEVCDALILDNPKLSESAIGRICGVMSPDTWSTYVNARRKIPPLVMLRLWHEFGAEPGWMIAGDARHNDPAFEEKRRRLLQEQLERPPRRGKRRRSTSEFIRPSLAKP
jgi:hypothetical protein